MYSEEVKTPGLDEKIDLEGTKTIAQFRQSIQRICDLDEEKPTIIIMVRNVQWTDISECIVRRNEDGMKTIEFRLIVFLLPLQ